MDETLDNKATDQTTIKEDHSATLLADIQTDATGHKNQDIEPANGTSSNDVQVYPALSELDITRYAQQIKVSYPTTDGAALYQIAALIPLHLRPSFEAGLGDAREAYRTEVDQRGSEPAR